MGRTFNRTPYSVNVPNKSDLKNYYFVHSNWKGLSDNKNYLSVDQETFSDCSNVYIDEDGLLKSRPCLKNIGEKLLIANVYDFSDVHVYDLTHSLMFYKNGEEYAVSYELKDEYKLVRVDNKIFIFQPTGLHYYDVESHTINDGMEYVYVPATKVITDGVTSNLESPNELTDSYIIRRLYDSTSNVEFVSLVGKNVKVTVDGKEYNIIFKQNQQLTFLHFLSELNKYTFADEYLLGPEMEGFPLISISNTGVIVMSVYSNSENPTWYNYYSLDGKIFYMLPKSIKQRSPAKVTDDGTHAIILGDELYAISILNTEDDYYFDNWTKLLPIFETQSSNYIYILYNTEVKFLSMHFLSLDTFIILAANSNVAEYESLTTCYCILCSKGEIKYTELLHMDKELLTSSGPLVDTYDGDKVFLYRTVSNCYFDGYAYVICLIKCNQYDLANDKEYYIGDVNSYYLHKINSTNQSMDGQNNIIPPATEALMINRNEISYTISNIPGEGSKLYVANYYTGQSSIISVNNVKNITLNYNSSRCILSNNGYLLTSKEIYYNCDLDSALDLSTEGIPAGIVNNGGSTELYLCKDNSLYSNKDLTMEVDEVVEGKINYDRLYPVVVNELNNYYFAKDDMLYISLVPSDGDFKWYFPKEHTKRLSNKITNLHPISDTQMAIFTENDIYYSTYDNGTHSYYKSKFTLGCKLGSTIITSYDGASTIFNSDIGLILLSYADFVASTEQVAKSLSDEIMQTYEEFNTDAIKLVKYKYWIIAYKQDCEHCLLYDIRNGSWWPWQFPFKIHQIFVVNNKLRLLCNSQIYELTNNKNYYFDASGINIDWHIKSQRLYLNSNNYLKHINNITLSAVIDNNANDLDKLSLDMTLINYRKVRNESDVQSFEFDVDSVRIYVKKLNYFKVNEFQYVLKSDDNDIRLPLSISNISIEYTMSRKVM